MTTIRTSLAAVIVSGLAGVAAHAETVQVKIAPDAPYEQALVCYQFHGIASQVMKAASENAEVPAEEKERLAMMSGFAGYMQNHWRQHIDTIKGARTLEQVNSDLKAKTAHVIADAKLGLEGDGDAQLRQQEIEKSCVS